MARGKLAELAYDLRANTEGLGRDLKDVEGQFGKLADYVRKHPYQSIGALSAAVLGVGIAATKMAADVDKGLRQVEARIPSTEAQVSRLRDTLRDMSLAGPHGQAELAGAAAEIARQGVGSLEEVQQRLAAVVKVSDATGEEMTGIVAGLDQAMDLFSLHSSEAEGFVAKLYATAANRMPITDLFGALQAAAPTVRDLGLDVDTTMRAIGALLEQGKNAKQAGSELKAYGQLGAEGAAAVKQLAASYDLASDATTRMNAAQKKMNESVEATAARVKNNLNAALIELGTHILPVAEMAARGLVLVLDQLNGRAADAIEHQKTLSGLGTLLQGGLELGRTGFTPNMTEQRAAAMRVGSALQDGTLDLSGYTTKQLFAIKAMLAKVYKDIPSILLANTQEGIGKVFAEVDKAIVSTMAKAKAAAATVRTPEEIKAGQDAAKGEREAALKRAEQAIAELKAKWDDLMQDQGASLEFLEKQAAKVSGDIVTEISLIYAEAIKNAPTEDARQRIIKVRDAAISAELKTVALANGEQLVKDGIVGMKEETITYGRTVDDTTDKLIAQARALQQSVDGALQLAEAFGLIDSRAANSLRALNQITGNLPALKDAWLKRGATSDVGGGAGQLIGAALPVAGAVASVIGGLISSAKAARKHARALADARRKLTESLQDRVGRIGLTDQQQIERDAAKQRRDDLTAVLDLLVKSPGIRIGTRDEFFAKDEGGQRKVLTDALAQEKAKFPAGFESSLMRALEEAIKQFDLVADAAKKAAAEMEAELATKRKDIDQSLAERRLRIQDRTDEADALAFKVAQKKELDDAEAGGVYTTEQLIELRSILNDEEKKYLDDARKRREDEEKAKAQTAARRTEDLQTRINAADGETPEEKARRREIEKRRELEDAMAEGADAATLALIKLAQAADDAAAAARAAMEAQREVEDLDVELLQLQGKTAEADARAAELALQRRWDDAVAAGKDPAVLAKLAEVIAAKRAELAAQQANGGAAAVSAGDAGRVASGGGATSAAGTGIGTATIVQVDRMIGLMGTFVAYQREELDLMKDFMAAALVARPPLLPPALPSSFTVGAGGQLIQVRVQLTQHFYGPVAGGREGAAALGALSLDAIETGLANNSLLSALGRGQVGRA